jgi:ketosteroid isomerase-like protein
MTDQGAPPPDEAGLTRWVHGFFAAVDSRDPDRIAAFFSDDVRIAFANLPIVVGREAVRRSFAQSAAFRRAVRHDITGVWTGCDGDLRVISVEANVTYTLADERGVTVPCTSTLRIRDADIVDYRVFIDTTPVWETT